MAFRGDFSSLGFADLIQLLGSTTKTGLLQLTRGEQWKKLYLREGQIVAMVSGEPEEFVGNTLVGLGKLRSGELQLALARQQREGRFFGRILVEEGRLEAEALQRYLLDTACAMIAGLMGWHDGAFVFEEHTLPAPGLVSMEFSIESLILEALRRLDETEELRARAPADNTILRLAAALDPVALDSGQHALLGHLDRPRSVRELRESLRAADYKVFAALTSLIDRGVLKRVELRTAPPPQADWRAGARALIDSGALEQAVTLLRERLAQDPASAECKSLLATAELLLAAALERALGAQAVPRIQVSMAALREQHLSASEMFVLSRIDGRRDVASVVEAVPLPRVEVLHVLQWLLEAKLIQLASQPTRRA